MPAVLVVLVKHGGVFAISEAGAWDVVERVHRVGVSAARHDALLVLSSGSEIDRRRLCGAVRGDCCGVEDCSRLCFFVCIKNRGSKNKSVFFCRSLSRETTSCFRLNFFLVPLTGKTHLSKGEFTPRQLPDVGWRPQEWMGTVTGTEGYPIPVPGYRRELAPLAEPVSRAAIIFPPRPRKSTRG